MGPSCMRSCDWPKSLTRQSGNRNQKFVIAEKRGGARLAVLNYFFFPQSKSSFFMNTSYEEEEPQEDPYCVGCHRLIEEGSVVQFGEGIWHFEWYRHLTCLNSSPTELK